MDWIKLAEKGNQWKAVVKMVMNFLVLKKAMGCLPHIVYRTVFTPVTLSRHALLYFALRCTHLGLNFVFIGRMRCNEATSFAPSFLVRHGVKYRNLFS